MTNALHDTLARSEQMAALVRKKVSERPYTDKAERMLILEMHEQLERCEAMLGKWLKEGTRYSKNATMEILVSDTEKLLDG